MDVEVARLRSYGCSLGQWPGPYGCSLGAVAWPLRLQPGGSGLALTAAAWGGIAASTRGLTPLFYLLRVCLLSGR